MIFLVLLQCHASVNVLSLLSPHLVILNGSIASFVEKRGNYIHYDTENCAFSSLDYDEQLSS